jgi:hypothetical protein
MLQEVAGSLENPIEEELAQELIELELYELLQSGADRRRC